MHNDYKYESFYHNRKSGGGSAYNYDLTPLITDFSFCDFVTAAEKSREGLTDHGGFLVITNNQYIVGYTAGFGVGAHAAAFARTMVDINYGSDRQINNQQDGIKLDVRCTRQYITARITYECYDTDENGRPKYSGYINFPLTYIGGKITPQQFEIFKEFYNDYNDDIKWITKKYNIYVRFCYKDEGGNTKVVETNDLDALYSYLEQNIDYNKVIEEEKIIIGESKRNEKKQ